MVGETGFEPATLCSQSRCATRLRYSPMDVNRPHKANTSVRQGRAFAVPPQPPGIASGPHVFRIPTSVDACGSPRRLGAGVDASGGQGTALARDAWANIAW